MAVILSKEESLKRINLRKDNFVNLLKDNKLLSNLRSRVGVVLDYSYSMKNLYRDGDIQELIERLIPLALKFDDNGSLDFWIFTGDFHRLGEINLNNFYNYIEDNVISKYSMGATNYAPVMADVYKKYIQEEPLDLPSYVLFITDGECSDKADTYKLLKDNSDKPVFWQFIGIGRGSFNTLEALDDLTDRVIDNADFFKINNLLSVDEVDLYRKLMVEYPSYLEEATIKNIISLKEEERTNMAVSLSKGGKVSLTKAASEVGVATLSEVVVGLGWDTNRYDGGQQFDLDAAAFMLGANGKVRNDNDFIFYNNKEGQGVIHTGDNRTGDGDGDDEQIKITLANVPADVDKIAFTVTIDQAEARNQNFGMVENSFIRIFDAVTGTEMIRYDLGEDYSVETAVVVGELYRHNGEWKFNAVGSGFSGGLAALCRNFGVDV